MKVGILGLGLIGGSMARAYAKTGHTVYAAEKNADMLAFAQLAGAVHGVLDESSIGSCDLLLLAIYPDGCSAWLEENAAEHWGDAVITKPVSVEAMHNWLKDQPKAFIAAFAE